MTEREWRFIKHFRNSIEAIQQDIRSIRDEEKTHHQKRDIQPRWLDPLIAASQQSETNNASNSERQHAVQNSIRRAAWAAFWAAAFYAGVACLLWKQAHDHFTIEQRAWLEFRSEDAVVTLDQMQNKIMPLTLWNVGKTPAKGVTVSVASEVLPRRSGPTFKYPNGHILMSGIVFQNRHIDATDLMSDPFTADERASLARGETYLVTYAQATWTDIFDKPHWSTFCVRRSFTNGFSNSIACKDYNDTDAK